MKKSNKELPQILVLKRTYVQRFPNGQLVALYHSELLDQYITVPLDGSKFSNTTESVLEQLKEISTTDLSNSIIFEDLSELLINKECSDIILEYSESNKEDIKNIFYSDKDFLNILETAVKQKSDLLESELNKEENFNEID